MQQKSTLWWVVGIIVIVAALFMFGRQSEAPGSMGNTNETTPSTAQTTGRLANLDSFATCIRESGAKFYGAFWCPHCQNQKELFGNSAKLLPYVECSTSDGKSQLQICKDKKINGYPTWIFAGGIVRSGEVSLEDLSLATNCPLPGLETEITPKESPVAN